MKYSHRSIYFNCPTTVAANFRTKEESTNIGQISQTQRLSLRTGPEGKPENASFKTTRCSEKGCVFPASPQGRGKCTYHWHQQEEPVLFRSRQPTGMLLDPARIGPDDEGEGGCRKRDRRRLAAIWEQFQNDGAS